MGDAAESSFVASLAAGEIGVENITRGDWQGCAALLAQYPFLGLVDASVVAIAERLHLRAVVTTDRRDFGRVRPAHASRFELLP